ncbi:MAG: methyltransferase domain-containing protein [Sphingomonadales bacterium]|nr:methyltransferase domain-containing protein [Sphingomonadales bacterium]
MRAAALPLLALLAACGGSGDDNRDRPPTSREFPRAYRPASKVASDMIASEVQRDSLGEAQTVMDLADIRPGTTVADIGAGEGYYTIRLAERVGAKGRVLAQDINPEAIRRLGVRVERERLDTVSIVTGAQDDPRLPVNSFDRVFMVHMYHEVSEPYAFLWRLRPSLKPGGKVIVVDVDRPTDLHGIPPALLFCEFAAVGFRLDEFVRKPEVTGYYAQFELVGSRPAPAAIKPCRDLGKSAVADPAAKGP